MAGSDSKKRAKKLEDKGDRLVEQQDFTAAVEVYEEAIAIDPGNTRLYDKLIEAHSQGTEDWNIEEFTREVSWTMKQEVLENPRLDRLHQKLSPEFKLIYELIVRFAMAADEEEEEKAIDEILQHGELALIPMLEFIRALKAQQDS